MSKEKTYKVQDLFEWYKKFENMDIKIQGNTKEFDIEIRDKYLPHLLGLQYINSNNNIIKGKRLYSYIKDNNLSDQEILSRVEQNYGPGKRKDISNRIETFPEFLKNLEKGIIVEKTLDTKMNVNYLIIQNKDNEFYHLGIDIAEPIKSIERYDEKEKIYVPFSFDKEKNEKLLKEFHLEKEEDFSIPKKLKINNKEFER